MEGTHFYLLRTTTTQEDAVVDMLYQKATLEGNTGVYAILHPGAIKGYVFIEALDLGDAIQLVQGVPHTKGFVKDKAGGSAEVDFDKEVKPLLTPKSSVLDVKKGDLVELIAGPFKGEKAKVIRVDSNKEEVTVELIEATVPIPVTAKGMHIKVVDRVTQEKAAESQKKDLEGRRRDGPVIGEGPLPPLRHEKKPKRVIIGGFGAEAPEEKKETVKDIVKEKEPEEAKDAEEAEEAKTEEKESKKKIGGLDEGEEAEEIDEEKIAEEDANYFADGEDPEELIDKK